LKPFSLEVKSAANVLDDFRLWISLLHALNLSGKIVPLFAWANTAVADNGVNSSPLNKPIDVEQSLS
jgi:hypothetical protein